MQNLIYQRYLGFRKKQKFVFNEKAAVPKVSAVFFVKIMRLKSFEHKAFLKKNITSKTTEQRLKNGVQFRLQNLLSPFY